MRLLPAYSNQSAYSPCAIVITIGTIAEPHICKQFFFFFFFSICDNSEHAKSAGDKINDENIKSNQDSEMKEKKSKTIHRHRLHTELKH